jgi:hypothetical protein
MSKQTREEHLQGCKRRALEYLDAGDVQNAIASMMSDLSKHDETRKLNPFIQQMGLAVALSGDPVQARRWIEGFR